MTTIRHYGVREQASVSSTAEAHAEALQIRGFTVVPSGLSPEQLQAYRDALDAELARQEQAEGGPENMARMGEADTVRAVLVGQPSFLDVATNPDVLAVARLMLGDYFVLMQQNGVVNQPSKGGHQQSSFHRDLPYQHWVSSRPLGITAVLALDPFEVETGCTSVLPASHKIEAFPSMGSAEAMEQPVRAPAGSYLVFDSMLFHRGGVNTSGAPRRAVTNVYTIPLIAQQISLPSALNGRWSDDAFLRRFLGYESDPAHSVEDYRQGRRARAGM
jgi:ectoine hydroxylase-related dioxygenase (phytanoyl-CoA dioxygenase family)